MDWNFLDRVMMKMKNVDVGCIRNVKYLILVNRSPKGSIQASKDLRQGDHFSHFYSYS